MYLHEPSHQKTTHVTERRWETGGACLARARYWVQTPVPPKTGMHSAFPHLPQPYYYLEQSTLRVLRGFKVQDLLKLIAHGKGLESYIGCACKTHRRARPSSPRFHPTACAEAKLAAVNMPLEMRVSCSNREGDSSVEGITTLGVWDKQKIIFLKNSNNIKDKLYKKTMWVSRFLFSFKGTLSLVPNAGFLKTEHLRACSCAHRHRARELAGVHAESAGALQRWWPLCARGRAGGPWHFMTLQECRRPANLQPPCRESQREDQLVQAVMWRWVRMDQNASLLSWQRPLAGLSGVSSFPSLSPGQGASPAPGPTLQGLSKCSPELLSPSCRTGPPTPSRM
jgi:hypothetical protein